MAHLACSNLESLKEHPRSKIALVTKSMAIQSLVTAISTSKESASSMSILAIGCVAVAANVSFIA